MNHITSPNEPYPSPQALSAATTSHTQGQFRISTRKLPISKSGAIDELTERIGIPIPEMIFGDNLVSITHIPTGWSLAFNAEDALDAVDKTDKNMLKVAYARDWESTRENTTQKIKEVVKPYDWSYSTTYDGTVRRDGPPSNAAATAALPQFQPAPPNKAIPIELLKRRDPILFFDEVVLYESELDDNGISIYSAKLRVHEHRMLLLCRLFMRLDNVIVRIRDTRVYVDFDTNEVIREYTAKEAGFDKVKMVSHIRCLLLRLLCLRNRCLCFRSFHLYYSVPVSKPLNRLVLIRLVSCSLSLCQGASQTT
jgi:type 2A phosphatase activator TIP41